MTPQEYRQKQIDFITASNKKTYKQVSITLTPEQDDYLIALAEDVNIPVNTLIKRALSHRMVAEGFPDPFIEQKVTKSKKKVK